MMIVKVRVRMGGKQQRPTRSPEQTGSIESLSFSSRMLSGFEVTRALGPPLRTESRVVFNRREEGLDHLGINIVAVELVQLGQPEIIAAVVQARFRRIIRVSPQV